MATKKEVLDYLHKNKIAKRSEVAKHFNTYPNFISQLLKGEIVLFDLNSKKDKHFTIAPRIDKEFDSDGLCSINNRIFSKHGKIKPTITHLVNSSEKGLRIKELNEMLKTDVRVYLRQLTKEGKIFRARVQKADISLSTNYEKRQSQIKNNKDEIIMDACTNKLMPTGINLLDETDPVLKDLEIIRQVKSGKQKTEVAKQFKITSKTVANICKRFNQGQTKALIKKREPKPYKITEAVESAIITEMVQNPSKTPEEIVTSIKKIKDISVKSAAKIMNKVKTFIKPKKKLILEIQ